MKISTAAREYLIEIEVRKFTPKTIRSYRNNLNLFLRYCETEAQITDVDEITLVIYINLFLTLLEIRRIENCLICNRFSVSPPRASPSE